MVVVLVVVLVVGVILIPSAMRGVVVGFVVILIPSAMTMRCVVVVVGSTLQVGSWQILQSAVLAPQELPDDLWKYQLNRL